MQLHGIPWYGRTFTYLTSGPLMVFPPFPSCKQQGKALQTALCTCVSECSLSEISSLETASQGTSTFHIQRLLSVDLVRYFPPPGNFCFPSTLYLTETFCSLGTGEGVVTFSILRPEAAGSGGFFLKCRWVQTLRKSYEGRPCLPESDADRKGENVKYDS